MEYAAGAIPLSSIICMGITLVLCIGVPIGMFIHVKTQTRATIRPLLTGILIFLVFAMGLEQGLHYLALSLDSPVKTFLTSNWWAYGLYGALAAGLFEETGRLVGYKLLIKAEDDPGVCLMYGVGHGGIEAILIGGISAVSNLFMGLSLRTMGMEDFLQQYDSYTASTLRDSAEQFYQLNWWDFLLPGLERAMAFALQIALSVLVFMAVKNMRKRYYFFLAILVHALIDFPAALYQFGTITNVWLVEGICLVATIIVCTWAHKEYQTFRREVY